MQPIEAQKGVSAESQLLNSLKVYLNNKNRLQPIIGLGNIMECVKTGTHNQEALYLCEVCVCRLSKADIRNHIMGSLHRYNYIRAWHPHLVPEGKENSDLSKLAWPLMELATLLEGKEGPGDVQLFEVEDAVYQRMATCSENDAATLINLLRDGRVEPESHSGKISVQPEFVLLAQNKWRQSKKSFKTSAGTNKPPSLIQSIVTPPVKSEGWFNNMYSSLSDHTQMSPFSVLSENNSFLDGYTGSTPLIGLFCVVECKNEDGHTYCFLCHCCRVRSNHKDIIDHLTGSSHLVNYLMETRPEQMEVLMADINDNNELLQSLAKKVEHDEGRGEMKVVNAPESLCILLTSKSYHWCIKMLCNGSMCTSTQKSKLAIKDPLNTFLQGPNVNNTSNQGMPGKCAVVGPKRMQTKRKMRNVSNTVFRVNLPISTRSVQLERKPFSLDSLPVSLDFDTGSFSANHAEHTSMSTTSELQQDFNTEEADAGQCMGPQRIFVSHYQEVGGYFSGNEYFNQPQYLTGTNDLRFHGENNYSRQHGSQERSRKTIYEDWQNGRQTQSECGVHTQDWASYNSYYGHEEGCTEQWYNLTSQSKAGMGVDVSREERQKMSSDAAQYDCRQQPQDQYMAKDHASPLTGTMGQHGLYGDLAPHLYAAWMNMRPQLGECLAHSYDIASEPRVQCHQSEQRQWQTYMEFTNVHTAPQSHVTQPMAHQANQVSHGMMSNLSYNI